MVLCGYFALGTLSETWLKEIVLRLMFDTKDMTNKIQTSGLGPYSFRFSNQAEKIQKNI